MTGHVYGYGYYRYYDSGELSCPETVSQRA